VLYTRAYDVDSASLALRNNPEMLSSDGKWKAHCELSLECTIRQTADPHKSFSLFSEDIATPLYWSPRGDLIVFARKCGEPTTLRVPDTRIPAISVVSPEWEAIVYDPRTGLEAAVGTFGGGDPYDGLRWYELTLAQ